MNALGTPNGVRHAGIVAGGLLLVVAMTFGSPAGADASTVRSNEATPPFPPPAGVALTATPAVVHLGEPVQLGGPFCAQGLTVVRATTYLSTGYPRLPIAVGEVDPATLAITQTPGGLTAIVTETRKGLGTDLSLECSDGTFGNARFEAFPVGAWWGAGTFGPIGSIDTVGGVVAPGQPIVVAGFTIDCAIGSTVSSQLVSPGGTTMATSSGAVEAEGMHGHFVFELPTPFSTPAGPAVVEMSCPTASGTFTDTTNVTISGPSPSTGEPDLPPTGGRGRGPLMLTALSLTAMGAALVMSSNRSRIDQA